MKRLFKLPRFASDEQNVSARLTYSLAVGMALMSILFAGGIALIAPELLRRALTMSAILAIAGGASMWLAQRGNIFAAGGLLVTALWIIVTAGSLTAGGINAPIFMGYVIVIMVGGIVLGNRLRPWIFAGCFLSALLIFWAQSANLLPVLVAPSLAVRLSVYLFLFAIIALLQRVNALNTDELLRKTKKSEARYRSLLENIPVTTYINSTDLESSFEYISPQIEKLLGYPRNSFILDPLFWTKILHPEDAEAVLRQSRYTAQSLEPFTMEYRVIARNGQTVWLRDEAVLVRDENGVPSYWLGVWTDITSLKKAEEEQAELLNRMTRRTIQLQTAADVARAATSILDIKELLSQTADLIQRHFECYYVGVFLIDETNEWAILRAATGEMGRQMLEMGHRLKVDESSMIGWCIVHQQARIALDVGADAVRFANPLLPKTRSEIALPLIAHGSLIGAMTIQSEKPAAFSRVDITALQAMADLVANALENARLFTERVQLNKELELQNEELERYTYTVSHDLRSPLVTIRGFLGYLKQDVVSGNLKRFEEDLNRIANAVDKMQSLLNDLLELSRIGRIANPPEKIPFDAIVWEALDLLTGPLDAAKIHLKVSETFPVVYVDRSRIVEVVQNLVGNAVKFMGNQAEPCIEIGTQGNDSDGKPVFFIRDNGIGIEPQYHERIFGLFNRLDPNIEGTGIGLTLVKRIIETHGGRIWVESERGKGATFFFTLPAA
jgi:PAS domain S-box-containing protein